MVQIYVALTVKTYWKWKFRRFTYLLWEDYAVCKSNKNKFVWQQEAELLRNLGLKLPLNKIPLLRGVLFWLGGLNIIMGKNGCNPDIFIRIFRCV